MLVQPGEELPVAPDAYKEVMQKREQALHSGASWEDEQQLP